MMRLCLAIFEILALCLIFNFQFGRAYHPDTDPSSFCYDDPTCGPSIWGGVCKTGKQQSPVNIPLSEDVEFTYTKFWMNSRYLLENVHSFYAQNNGHTAQYELNPNTSALQSDLVIYGGELPGNYKFAQLHFHWGKEVSEGSEHTLNGQRFPMEVHLVHYKSIYPTFAHAARATEDNEAIAAMAIFFNIGKNNNHLAPVIRTLKKLREPGEVTEFDFPLRILDLYPNRLEYVRYMGSFTTPTCDERVVWTVFLQPLEISEGQMNEFRHLSNKEGNSDANFRPSQPLNGRELKYYYAIG